MSTRAVSRLLGFAGTEGDRRHIIANLSMSYFTTELRIPDGTRARFNEHVQGQRHMRNFLLIGLTLMLAACGNDLVVNVPPPPQNVSGSYGLATVDGAGLPFPVLDVGAYHIQIASGSLALNADKTYILTFGLRVDDSGNIRIDSDFDTGTWTQMDNALSFTSTKGDIARTAVVSGNTITMQSSIRVLVLRK